MTQVIMGEGDGWVRGYVAETGETLWWFDTNPKDSVWPQNAEQRDLHPGSSWATVSSSRTAQDPEHGEGVGHLYAIDRHAARRHHRDRDGSGTTTPSGAPSPPAR